LTIVTVSKNDSSGFLQTLKSIDLCTIPTGWHVRHLICFGDISSRDECLPFLRPEQIDCIVSDTDTGIYDGMNKALLEIQNGWVIFLNSGDEFIPENFEVSLKKIENAQENVVQFNTVLPSGLLSPGKNFTYKQLFLAKAMHAHPSLLFRKEFFEDLLFDTQYKIAADYRFVLELCRIESIRFLEDSLSVFKAGGISTTQYNLCLLEMEIIRKSLVKSWFLGIFVLFWNLKIRLRFRFSDKRFL